MRRDRIESEGTQRWEAQINGSLGMDDSQSQSPAGTGSATPSSASEAYDLEHARNSKSKTHHYPIADVSDEIPDD